MSHAVSKRLRAKDVVEPPYPLGLSPTAYRIRAAHGQLRASIKATRGCAARGTADGRKQLPLHRFLVIVTTRTDRGCELSAVCAPSYPKRRRFVALRHGSQYRFDGRRSHCVVLCRVCGLSTAMATTMARPALTNHHFDTCLHPRKVRRVCQLRRGRVEGEAAVQTGQTCHSSAQSRSAATSTRVVLDGVSVAC